MRTLTVWRFTTLPPPKPRGLCGVASDYTGVVCDGHHASVDPLTALRHSMGRHVTRFTCRVTARDDQGHIYCVPQAPTLSYDAAEVLQAFARKCALDVAHLWVMPPAVKQYLRTGDPKLREAAWGAIGGRVDRRGTSDIVAGASASSAGMALAAGSDRPHFVHADASNSAADARTAVARNASGWGAAGGVAKCAAYQRQSARLGRMLRTKLAGSRASP